MTACHTILVLTQNFSQENYLRCRFDSGGHIKYKNPAYILGGGDIRSASYIIDHPDFDILPDNMVPPKYVVAYSGTDERGNGHDLNTEYSLAKVSNSLDFNDVLKMYDDYDRWQDCGIRAHKLESKIKRKTKELKNLESRILAAKKAAANLFVNPNLHIN